MVFQERTPIIVMAALPRNKSLSNTGPKDADDVFTTPFTRYWILKNVNKLQGDHLNKNQCTLFG